MYAPKQYRPERKPKSQLLVIPELEPVGPVAAPPVYSVIEPHEEEREQEKEEAGPEATSQNAVANNDREDESQGAESEGASTTTAANEAPTQRKALGRGENPPQFKLAAGAPYQFKIGPAPLQMKEGQGGGGGSAGGGGLPDAVKGKMEGAFNTSFDDVKITANSSAASDAGALAFAQGNNIHFAPGQFNPESKGGQELLGHELAHVVQQRQGRVQANAEVNGMAVNNDKGLEAEADSLGAKAAQFKADPAASPKSLAGSAGSGPAQMKMDPEATSEDKKEAKEKNVDRNDDLKDTRLALNGFEHTPHENEGEESSEAESTGAGNVEAKAENNDEANVEESNATAQVPADEQVTAADETTANTTEAAGVDNALAGAEDEGAEAESEEKAAEEAGMEDKAAQAGAEEGAAEGEGGAKGKGGAEGGAGDKGGAKGEGGAETPAAEGGAQTAAPVAAVEAQPVTPAPSLDSVTGDFGASEPNPPMAMLPAELANTVKPEQIVMETPDGDIVVKGVEAESEAPEVEGAEGGNPIQMAPDPDNPKGKKKPKQVPKEITEQIAAKKREAANGLIEDFKAKNTAKVDTLKALVTTIEPQINQSAGDAKAVVEASVNTNRQAIADDVIAKKGLAEAEAVASEGIVKGQYDAIITKIKDKTTTERDRIQKVYDDNEKNLTDLETKAIEAAGKAYDDAAKAARDAGKKECEAIDAKIGSLIGTYNDPEEKVRTAMVTAAIDTGKGFKEKVMEVAEGAANEIPKGKAEFIKGIQDKIKEARAQTKAHYDASIEGLRIGEEGAIKSADANLQGQKDAIKALLDSTIKALDDHQTSQVQSIEDAGILASDNIDKTATSAIDGLKKQLETAINDIETQIADTVAKATNVKDPDEAAIRALLDGVSKSIDSSVKDSETNIKTGITDSGKEITDLGTNTDTGLAEMATQSAVDTQGMLEGLTSSYIELEGKSQEAFDGIYTRHEEDSKKTVDESEKEILKIVKDTGDGFTTAQTGLEDTFKKKVEDLGKDLKDVTKDLDAQVKKNVDEAAEKAREPWWKTALKWIVTIVIMIVVTALIVAFCPFTLGGLLLAFAIGAAGGILTLAIKNLIDGKLSSWQEYLTEGIAGGIGGVFTLLGGQLASKFAGAAVSKLAGWSAKFAASPAMQAVVKFSVDVVVGTICDTIGSGFIQLGKNLVQGKEVSFAVFWQAMKENALNNFLGNFGGSLLGNWIGKTKIGQKIAGWMGKTATSEVAEAEAKALAEAQAKALAEQEAKELAEQQAKALAEQQAKELAEQQAKELAEQQARELAEQQAKEAAEAQAKAQAEQQAKELAEQQAREAAEQQAKELAEQQAKEAAERQAKELAEQQAKEAAEKQAKELAEQQARELAEQQAKEAAEKQAKELAEQQARELAEQQAKDLAEKQAKELAEQEAKEAAEAEAKALAEQQAKEAAEAQAKKTGAELADELGYPKAPDGYHWTRNGDSPTPSLQRNPGSAATLPPAKYDPALKKFVPEVDPPKGYNWQWRDGKLVIARNPGMKNSLPRLAYDPSSPSGFKNLDTGQPYISHLDVRDSISGKIDGKPDLQMKLTDDEIKGIIDKAQALGFSRADIDAIMGIAARKHWVSAATLHEVIEMVAEKARTSTIPFKPGWDFMSAWRTGQERLLAGGKLSPEEYLDPTYVANHLANFNGKASYLVPDAAYKRFVEPNPNLGRGDGNFVSTAQKIDDALRESGGDIRKLEEIMGIPRGAWGDAGVWRVDIINPQTANMRLPSGVESGANEFWIPGGLTSGGAMEAVIDPVAKTNANIDKVIP